MRGFLLRLHRTTTIVARTSFQPPRITRPTVWDWLIIGGVMVWAIADATAQDPWFRPQFDAMVIGGLLAWLVVRLASEPTAPPMGRRATELELFCIGYGERWARQLEATIRFDRAAAEAAAADLYRASKQPVPEVRVWCRSPRESLLARPLIGELLQRARSSPSWEVAWTAAIETCRPVGPDAVWEDAVAHIGPQLPSGAPRRVGSAHPITVLRPIEPMPRLGNWIQTGMSLALQRATQFDEVVAYQLAQEGRRPGERAPGLSENKRVGLINLAVREFLREMPPAWVAARRLLRSAHDGTFLDGAMIFVEPPTSTATNDDLQPHAEDGPARTYADGFSVWARDGVPVPRLVIDSPEDLTVAFVRAAADGNFRRHQQLIRLYGLERYRRDGGATPELIDAEPNIEMRRTMIDAYGASRYVAAKGTVIHADVDGLGQARRLWSTSRGRDEALVFVEVVNSTPEADGSRHTYWLRVPPHVRTCQEAVAWTFGINTSEYRPLVET